MTDDLQAAIGSIESILRGIGYYASAEQLGLVRESVNEMERQLLTTIPLYRISEDKNAPTYSGHLHDAEFLELLVDQCGATAGDIVGVSNLGIGGWRIVGDAEGVRFKVERIR